jgi:CNT family concentrative nucleoside transporter
MLHPVLANVALLGLAWLISEARGRIPWRTVIAGLVLQIALAVLLIHFPPAIAAIMLLNRGANALQAATDAGTGFVFGYLGGATLPFAEVYPAPASFWPSERCRSSS